MTKQPIGVFDSGLGGLTILKTLRKSLPYEDLIYFGDTANVPYGSKSKEAVIHFSSVIGDFLLQKKVKMIVIACNTASALAIETLKANLPIPILGVIEPGAQKAMELSQDKRIAILGTEATVKSKAYLNALQHYGTPTEVIQKACPLFVPLVEEDFENRPATELIAREYLIPIIDKKIKTVVLGCTHYPLLKKLLGKILGDDVLLIDPADALAERVKKTLLQNNQLETSQAGKITIFASDDKERFQRRASYILKEDVKEVFLQKLL